MCGRFTVKATWAELVALYRLTMDAPPHNLRPRYNVCPTDPVDVVTAEGDKRELVSMRHGSASYARTQFVLKYFLLRKADGGWHRTPLGA
jgi:putative SOS response-associated peptidase YedK